MINKLLMGKEKGYFISPHFDDAIFSAGALIDNLKNIISITVITVFTKPSLFKSSFTEEYIKKCGFQEANKLFEERERENKEALNKIGIRSINCGFIDFAWREKRHFFEGKTEKDNILGKRIILKLKSLISKDSFIFCPIGVGDHPDHIIVRDICQNHFNKVIYWQDYPYALKHKTDKEFVKKNKLSLVTFKNIGKKRNLMSYYGSQIKFFFENKHVFLIPEMYYFKQKPWFFEQRI